MGNILTPPVLNRNVHNTEEQQTLGVHMMNMLHAALEINSTPIHQCASACCSSS